MQYKYNMGKEKIISPSLLRTRLNIGSMTDGRVGNNQLCAAVIQMMRRYLLMPSIAQNYILQPRLGLSLLPDIILARASRLDTALWPLLYKAPCPVINQLPDILVTTGRTTIAASTFLKHRAKRLGIELVTIHIHDPRIAPDYFDVVITAEHDNLRGHNVVTLPGSPSLITPDILGQYTQDKTQSLSPCTAILLGGDSRHGKVTADEWQAIQDIAQGLLQTGHTVQITASRRTPVSVVKKLEYALSSYEHCHIWYPGHSENNPYYRYLALADQILVTNDSVNMVSDAVAAQKPVYWLSVSSAGQKFHHFLNTLQKMKLAAPWGALNSDISPIYVNFTELAVLQAIAYLQEQYPSWRQYFHLP